MIRWLLHRETAAWWMVGVVAGVLVGLTVPAVGFAKVDPPKFMLGDMNGDELVDNFDIIGMELALTDPDAYVKLYPRLTDYKKRGDVNQDGMFNNFDLSAFEELLKEK